MVHRAFIAPAPEGMPRPGVLRELHAAMVARSRDLQRELLEARERIGREDWSAIDRTEALILELSTWSLWIERRLPAPGAQAKEEKMGSTDTERIAAQRATVDRHMKGENEHDWDTVHDTFVQDDRAYWDAVPMATRFSGIGGVKDFYSTMEAAFPDAEVIVTHAYDVPGTSIREVTIKGTHVGEFAGIAANGNPYCYEAIGVYVFADGSDAGLLLGERVYFDLDSVLRQLRGDEDAAVGGIGLANGVTL